MDRQSLIDLIPEGFGPVPGHAGDFETSLMLSTRPEQVSHNLLEISRLIDESAAEAGGSPRFDIGSPAGERHLGFTDDSRHASAETGNELLDKAASALAGLIEAEFA
jgi:creatinine amidohydrolase